MYINESCRTRTFEVSALLRSVQNRHPPDVVHRLALNQKEVRTDIYARVLPDSNGSRSPLCSGRCRTDIHRMSCTVSRSIRKRLEPIYMQESCRTRTFEVSALLRSVQNRHPPDVVHRLALNQKEVRTDIYMQESCRTRTVRIFVPLRSVQDCVFLAL